MEYNLKGKCREIFSWRFYSFPSVPAEPRIFIVSDQKFPGANDYLIAGVVSLITG
jgi:hypothetical protein